MYLENGKSHNKSFGILKKKNFIRQIINFLGIKIGLKLNNPPKKKPTLFGT